MWFYSFYLKCVVWLKDDKHMNIPNQHSGKEENLRMSYICKFLSNFFSFRNVLKTCKCRRGFYLKGFTFMAVCNVKIL